MKESRFWLIFTAIILAIVAALFILIFSFQALINTVRETTQDSLQPINQVANDLSAQLSQTLHPTPTILPDPISVIHEIRSLARLETVQYSIEKVITAETGQGTFSALFGDRLLFVAHGQVIAGVDLAKLDPDDLYIKDRVLYIKLPQAEIFVTDLDNENVYNRDTGFLSKGNINLETEARRSAEKEIEKAALEDGILSTANLNAENYLSSLFRDLGYPEVIFLPADKSE